MGLAEIHRILEEADGEVHEKVAEEMEKEAEEDAAGRIMARGFMDELEQLSSKF